MAFTGITFSRQKIAPSDDAIVRRTMLQDGALVGCGLSYVGSSLIWAPGHLILCGRQIRHTAEETFTLDGANSGFARVVISIDLTRTATADTFDQVYTSVDYAQTVAGFSQLITEDINGNGSVYQFPLAVVSLAPGGITGIVSKLEETTAGGDGLSSILVSAPSGSIVSCTDGTVNKTAGEADGLWTFKGCGIGQWTVTASKDGEAASTTVSIHYETQRFRYSVLLSFFSATISVTYPEGSTCTCSSGATSLTAAGTGGSHTFTVPFAGAWTVSCTDGYHTGSDTVVIHQAGQSESVILSYALWLYKDGVTSYTWNAVAKPMSSNSGSYTPVITQVTGGVQVSLTSTQGAYKGGIYYCGDAIDLTDYSTLAIEYDKTSVGKVYLTAWTSIGSIAGQNYSGRVQLTGGNNQVAALDVSAISGGHLIGLAMEHSASSTTTTTIKRMYLE